MKTQVKQDRESTRLANLFLKLEAIPKKNSTVTVLVLTIWQGEIFITKRQADKGRTKVTEKLSSFIKCV